jgi:chromosomal replication initiation ATPase DnaA
MLTKKAIQATIRLESTFYMICALVDTVSQCYGVKAADILDRKTRAKWVRQMVMELCYRHCNLGQKQIGQIFGVDYSTVSVNRSRLESRLKSGRRLKKQFDQIVEKTIYLRDDRIGIGGVKS